MAAARPSRIPMLYVVLGAVRVYHIAGCRMRTMDDTTIQQAAERLHFTCTGDGADDILLIHGFASSLRIWEPLTAALPHAARWWALDLCGFGQSASLAGAATTLDDHIRVIAAFCEQHSLCPRVVMGHSMGGMLTL